MPLHVCFFSARALGTIRPDVPKSGGAELKSLTFARLLAQDPDFVVTLFCYGPVRQEATIDGVRVKSLVYPHPRFAGRSVLERMARLAGTVSRLSDEHADVYVQTCFGTDTWACATAARLADAPFVYWVACPWDIDGTFARQAPFPIGLLYRRAFATADRVICQTHDQARIVARGGGPLTAIVPNVSLDPPATLPEEPRTEVLWVGRLHSIKGPDRFVDLARHFPSVTFRMLIAEKPREPLEGVPDNLIQVFGASSDRIDRHYRQARVLVNTSLTEGFPNTFLEAARLGTPILTLSANPDRIVDRYGLGLWSQDDPERLVRDLARLLEDRELWRNCSDHGPAYVREHHDPGRACEALKQLLIEIASVRHRPTGRGLRGS